MTTLARTRSWLGLSLAIGVFVACLLVSLAFGPASLSLHDLVHYAITGPVHGDPGNTIFCRAFCWLSSSERRSRWPA